jgi:hypothetical protein
MKKNEESRRGRPIISSTAFLSSFSHKSIGSRNPERQENNSLRESQKPIRLHFYFYLSVAVPAVLSGFRDLWISYGTADVGTLLCFLLLFAVLWIRGTLKILAEIGCSKIAIFPFLAPTALIIWLQVIRSTTYCRAIAFVQIAFALLLMYLSRGARSNSDSSQEGGDS